MKNSLTGIVRVGSRTIHKKIKGNNIIYVPTNLDGCVLYLPMAEKTINLSLDHSGKLNHGTIYGAIETDGKVWKGLSFDGIDDYIDCSNDNNFDMGDGDFSVCLWFITNNCSHADLLMKGSYSSGGKHYAIVSVSGDLAIIIDDDGGNYKGVISSTNYMDGSWHYVVGVRDGNNLRLYVDGVEDANSPTDITNYGSLDSIRPLRIGCGSNEATSGNPGNWFTGKIDEVKIYNRVLSPEEILAHYQQEL